MKKYTQVDFLKDYVKPVAFTNAQRQKKYRDDLKKDAIEKKQLIEQLSSIIDDWDLISPIEIKFLLNALLQTYGK